VSKQARLDAADLAPLRPWLAPWWRATPGDGPVFFYMILIHVLTVVGIILTPLRAGPCLRRVWPAFLGGLGTTVAYHRGIAHKSVKLHPVARNILTFFAMFNGSARRSRGRRTIACTTRSPTRPRHLQPARRRLLVVASALALASRWAADPEVLQGDRPPRLSRLARFRFRFSRSRSSAGCRSAGRRSSGLDRCGWYGRYTRSASSTASATCARTPAPTSRRRRRPWLSLMHGFQGENWHQNHHDRPGSARLGLKPAELDVGWYASAARKGRPGDRRAPPRPEPLARRGGVVRGH